VKFRRLDGKRLFMFGAFWLIMFHLMIELPGAPALERSSTTSMRASDIWQNEASRWPRTYQLAEMVREQDCILYQTDSKDRQYERRQREEREKENKSWNMLQNLIIDGRKPPRRFSDPRTNNNPQ
jgi:hypothetical protein